MVTRTGMIGFSEGNGHPFSFSAIINGFDRDGFNRSGWPVILEYLDKQPKEMFGIGDAKVTCAWTQKPDITTRLCAACGIDMAVDHPSDMLGQIDALIIARDDWKSHAALAMPFLQSGIPVFVDKPLSLDPSELRDFWPYLCSGLLMSTSGMRYAIELDQIVARMDDIGDIRFVSAAVLNDIEKYGIHMLDAVASIGLKRPVLMSRADTAHQSYDIQYENGVVLRLDCLGAVAKTFHLNVYGSAGNVRVELANNFMAFRRTLQHFFKMVDERIPPIEPDSLLGTMNLIRQAQAMSPSEMMEVSNAKSF
ncbi:Gfo/Idh/MocA family oxidoreductase [Thalassospira australica]|uniref:Gfo/Idh/MocA family oxidoreductase n=1 Tax=Thalassospira australica TaxID=1528106 RepID=UPI000690DBD9|nr:Gfo/Idh/MocA family oxidoreductase [Thalassospira australica]